jgi:alkanesulfonate monooxygenase SsuD/methylene tetrahydromethanopterin reductase-like flavin-dependent oxidoreductase (luciferase family)
MSGLGVGLGAFISLTDANGQEHGAILRTAVDHARFAERMGCDSVWINEHHFMGFSICPDSIAMAGYLLGATARVRVGTAVSLIPFQHPVSIAERAAMLDGLSGGRFDLGLGRGGYPLDTLVFGRASTDLGRAMDEGIGLIHRALCGEFVDGAGTLWSFPPVKIAPRPATRPHPPIFVAGQQDSTLAIAAARGLPLLLSWHQTHGEREQVVRRYDAALAAAGWTGPRPGHVGSVCVHIADDRAAAQAELAPRFRAWLAAGRTGAIPRTLPADHPHAAALREVVAFGERKAATEESVAARLMANNAVGTVDDVVAWFREDMARTGTRRYAVFFDVIGTPDRAQANLARLMTEVAPALAAPDRR